MASRWPHSSMTLLASVPVAGVAGWLVPALVALLAVGAVLAAVLALPGCEQAEKDLDADTVGVKISGRTFFLELADDEASRVRGLSHREHLDPDGGMLFVFPRSDNRYFVMRHCVIPIDIIFLDGSGRVVAMHEMTIEEPKGENESDAQYESRLKRYPSRFSAQFAIELAGGTLKTLQVKEGDVIPLKLEALKSRAQ